ncbi:alkaline phosphatase [Pontibacillus litoralis]|uniref:Alkaline phosphatase n=1 Tax=Pontibacillus litoralis JSM 072002 TaxID=1385512 RepID=A0A0A5G4N5_9BACI|nr:alkaline phosphatase [Pontibacillus litoralis]KGX86113.1 alkaline phosphatase [Pontibacillus litoralis JSM 072002]
MLNKNFSKKALSIVAATTIALTGFGQVAPTEVSAEEKEKEIKNVIFLIGDGMGPSYTTAYRYVKDDPETVMMEPTAFDPHLVGMQKVNPEDPEENITDSAAAATAMATGEKTYNGAVAVDNDKSEIKTVLEQSKENGMATGLVATSQINHATPASFGAHDEDRGNYNEIADDYYDLLINDEHQVDVMLGGGTDYFVREDRDLTEEFQADGYSYVTTKEELMADDNEQVLGLFAPVGLPKMIDRTEEVPSLEEMTTSALDRLSKDEDGFFLMVEGSQIDWAGHSNDIVGAMSEMEDFEKAFAAAIEFAEEDGETLVVTTADHSTGGLSIGVDGPYEFDPEAIKAAQRTPEFMAAEIEEGGDVEEVLNEYTEFDLTKEEIKSVKKAQKKLKKDEYAVTTAISTIFNERARAGWTTGGHTGVDVPVYAYGPGKERFAGTTDNTDQANTIFSILEENGEKEPEEKKNGFFNFFGLFN